VSYDVMIAVGPNKASNTVAVLEPVTKTVIEAARFANTREGYERLASFAQRWEQRRWAVEGCRGTGRSLAQQLVADGEHVLDVPAKLAARVRVHSQGHGRPPPQRRPRLLRQETGRRQDPQRGPARPETADQRRRLRAPRSGRPPGRRQREEPGRAHGNDSVASAAGSHPEHRLFGQATPGPGPTLRPRQAARGRKTTARPAKTAARTT
jgi:hypothetical protein